MCMMATGDTFAFNDVCSYTYAFGMLAKGDIHISMIKQSANNTCSELLPEFSALTSHRQFCCLSLPEQILRHLRLPLQIIH